MDPKDAPERADIVIRNTWVIDGQGRGRWRGDLAVTGERIVALGDLGRTTAERDIDGTDLALSPGFIDVHSHDDRALLESPEMTPKISQGVTTVVAGNCGISLAPLRLDAWPPSPLDLLGDQSFYCFDAFGDFTKVLAKRPAATNAALLVGHTTLRHRHMGGDLERPAKDAELAVMESDVEAAMAQGAIGLSTGLDYAEAVAAPAEEVVTLATAAARHDGLYASHTRNYFDQVEEALEEALGIARAAEIPLILSHHQVTGQANFGRSTRTLARIEEALMTQSVGLDAYPYAASSKTLDPLRCQPGVRVMVTWSEPHPEAVGRDVADLAAEWGCDEIAAAERLLPAGAVYFQLDEADVQRILAFRETMIGSDGLPYDRHPHPRLWGAFPRVLGHYARDLGLFSLEEAVYRMTGLSARTFGFEDRGILRPGAFADLVLFDPKQVIDKATFEDPAQLSEGIIEVWVNGETVWHQGVATGARPGQVLRRVPALI